MRPVLFVAVIVSLLTLSDSRWLSAQDESPSQTENMFKAPAPAPDSQTTLTKEEELLVQANESKPERPHNPRPYFIKVGPSLAVYEPEFKDFLDHGISVSLGTQQEYMYRIFVAPSIGLTLLKGDWHGSNQRNIIPIGSETYYPGYASGGDIVMSEADLPDENLGTGFHSEGYMNISSSELLQDVQLETSLYLIPLMVNAIYHLHDDGKKVNPYVGGGLGFCIAKRDVESNVLKERNLEGPDYNIRFNNHQTILGQIVQAFGGVEIPFHGDMKIVAEANASAYNLRSFDPILEISYKKANPDWYAGSDLSQWNYETPQRIGEFQYSVVTSLYLGLIIPF